MNTIVRATLALVSFALGSALYASSVDVYVDIGQSINLSIGGTNDGNITIVNLDTNQTVATVTALTQHGNYGYTYYFYGDTYVSGATVSNAGYANDVSVGSVNGLPAGNYRIIATGWQMSDFGATSWGNYAEMTLYSTYDWMDFYISIY